MFDEAKVSKEQQDKRLAICATCEHNKMSVCMKCGCLLKLKTQWRVTKCPVGKWGKEYGV